MLKKDLEISLNKILYKYMIKLKKLLLEQLNKPKIGEKFVGDVNEIILDNTLQQDVQNKDIEVTNKQSGDTYFVTKKWYQKHKDLYGNPKQQIKTKVNKKQIQNNQSSQNNKFMGDTKQINKQIKQSEPKNAQQFIKMYMSKPKDEKKLSEDSSFNFREIIKINPRIYTAINDYTDQGYKQINLYLRKKLNKKIAPEVVKSIQDQIKLIREGLSVCKSYDGVCYRLLVNRNKKLLNLELKPGDIFHCDGFTSTTYNTTEDGVQTINNVFSAYIEDYQLFIKSKNGKIIKNISKHEGQKQVLFDINSKFKVIDVKNIRYSTIQPEKVLVKRVYLIEI